jgi:nitrogen fixation protein NifU and related proteins
MDNLYHELLLDLYHHPLNKKILESYDTSHQEFNPLCGEEITVFLKIDLNGTVADIAWQSSGCVISQSGASIITELCKGKNKSEILAIKPELIFEQLGLKNLNATRQRCATLALHTLQTVIKKQP